MKSARSQLKILKDQFPEQENLIDLLYKNDSVFKTLVDDYIECRNYLDKYKTEFSSNLVRLGEFENAKQELELELRKMLKGKTKGK